MANVIKLVTPPQKWLVHQQYKLPHLNQLVKEETHADARAFAVAFKKMRFKVKNLVLDFCLKKDSINQAAEQQSVREYKAQLVKETLQLAVNMQRMFALDAPAIDTLAHRVAANILNCELTEHYQKLVNIESELIRAFSLRIVLPRPYVDLVTSSFHPLFKILAHRRFLRHTIMIEARKSGFAQQIYRSP